jgi:hypothetical protein
LIEFEGKKGSFKEVVAKAFKMGINQESVFYVLHHVEFKLIEDEVLTYFTINPTSSELSSCIITKLLQSNQKDKARQIAKLSLDKIKDVESFINFIEIEKEYSNVKDTILEGIQKYPNESKFWNFLVDVSDDKLLVLKEATQKFPTSEYLHVKLIEEEINQKKHLAIVRVLYEKAIRFCPHSQMLKEKSTIFQ